MILALLCEIVLVLTVYIHTWCACACFLMCCIVMLFLSLGHLGSHTKG